MKKIINKPADFVAESIDGLIKSHPEIYSLAKDNSSVVTRAKKSSNKVGMQVRGLEIRLEKKIKIQKNLKRKKI